eukprot:2909828-Prymnesium_polylepis.3
MTGSSEPTKAHSPTALATRSNFSVVQKVWPCVTIGVAAPPQQSCSGERRSHAVAQFTKPDSVPAPLQQLATICVGRGNPGELIADDIFARKDRNTAYTSCASTRPNTERVAGASRSSSQTRWPVTRHHCQVKGSAVRTAASRMPSRLQASCQWRPSGYFPA